ncbi:HNH endonuclease signature motif containing protein, partial [Streptomyces scabiei]
GVCWEWTRATHKGYGVTWADGRTQQAHRVVWERLVGPIPVGLELDHLCRNHGCVSPEHCEPVTGGENTRRGAIAALNAARAARQTVCINGHDLGDAYRRANGHRICRSCVSIRNRRRYA